MTEQHHKRSHRRFSNYFYNTLTYIGVVMAALVIACEVLLFGIDFFSPHQSMYLGIFTYVILPPFLIIGLILIPIGARWKQIRVSKGLDIEKPKAIRIDLSQNTHQNALMIFVIGSLIVLIMTAVGSYKAFQYTESAKFCGLLCHNIMGPEYQRHEESPHARVKCVECHIGSGAGWYVHYKMAGVRMLVKAINGTYARPVPAPVESLRPAKETCEQCHWPGKSFSAIQLKKTYYPDDPTQGESWVIKMLIKTGGQEKSDRGIHAHMFYDEEIYYIADDAKRQSISWVKTVSKSGDSKIYTTKDSKYKEVAPPNNKIRKMDCMDCHNRPTHRFEAPDPLINRAITEGDISPTIPMIKGKGVEALSKEYKTLAEATEKIRTSLKQYYSKKHAEYYASHQSDVEKAIKTILTLYEKNFFPEMKARWDAYPDNIGHMDSLGCFRCHDNEHKTKTGDVISRDCRLCHIITQQGNPSIAKKDPDGMEFQHPFDGDESWKTQNCSDCHNGGG